MINKTKTEIGFERAKRLLHRGMRACAETDGDPVQFAAALLRGVLEVNYQIHGAADLRRDREITEFAGAAICKKGGDRTFSARTRHSSGISIFTAPGASRCPRITSQDLTRVRHIGLRSPGQLGVCDELR